MLALTGFGVVALVLSAFGLYAVVALTSQLRRREYAIRVALGARREGVRRLVLAQGLRLAVAGAIAGTGACGRGHSRGAGPAPWRRTARPRDLRSAVGRRARRSRPCPSMLPAVQAGRVDPAETLKGE